MAVYAAHLTRTLQGTPTIFQVSAQEALGATVKPALQKVAEYLAACYPGKCGWMVDWYDELYLLFDCALQYYYLKHYAASFSETFYGLIRIPTSSRDFHSGQQLPLYLEKASLLLLVFVPYLRDKVERIVERWRERDEDGTLGKSSGARLQRAAIKVYSIAYTSWHVARLAQLARYARGAASSHAPALAALGLALRDAPPRAPHDHTWSDLLTDVLTGNFGAASESLPLLGAAALRAAEWGAFGVQLLRWREAAPATHTALPAPTPPQREERADRWRNKCPICLQTWKIPTVLPVSGYIFCYVCVSRQVRARGACPVTRCPARETELVRLYLD